MTALAHRLEHGLTLADREPNRVVLRGIDWQTYCTIADALPERPIRVTYDRGDLEIMTVSVAHERFKSLLGLVMLALAEVFRRQIGSFGSFTHRRVDLLRALEPDLCFYLQSFKKVRGKRSIDLERDPPPDLSIEVEISRSALNRMDIYAALGVAELWRLEKENLQVYVLLDCAYVARERSPTFPKVPIAELFRFLEIGLDQGDLAMMTALRKWARGLKKSGKR
jgi:Uma2 family endonuclease